MVAAAIFSSSHIPVYFIVEVFDIFGQLINMGQHDSHHFLLQPTQNKKRHRASRKATFLAGYNADIHTVSAFMGNDAQALGHRGKRISPVENILPHGPLLLPQCRRGYFPAPAHCLQYAGTLPLSSLEEFSGKKNHLKKCCQTVL